MAIKKSALYSSLWKSCDELRGGMDASQYKDYVLTLLFIKYVSDKYAGITNSLIEIPKGGSFEDLVKLIGNKEIGDKINKAIGKLANANGLKNVIDVADFNDEEKLGKGKSMQDRLSKLISIFKDLDFQSNRAQGDDLLGDAYEYLMRNFATESGKSKGQFYTPAEVSRIMAKVIGINQKTRQDQTVYDPTCGSGSLLLKAADETEGGITIYGQEMDVTTTALAKMNMILHDNPTADIAPGGDSSLSDPFFKSGKELKTFDFAVANPPFSFKSWKSGFNPNEDIYGRFDYGVPPARNGDYAFLLHIIRSLKSTGKAAVILPHGVLFRGNVEAAIRKEIIKRGYIKGIIGLPTNLFYGTGIPACIVVLDKQHSSSRKNIFMINASNGFIKDGNKNRLRSQDIHKIVDVFNKQLEVLGYSRKISISEIADPKNDYNLNLPRYIDNNEESDTQNLTAHIKGGIPKQDIENLEHYWKVFSNLRNTLFKKKGSSNYLSLQIQSDEVSATVLNSDEYKKYALKVKKVFEGWKSKHEFFLKNLSQECKTKDVIMKISEDLLTTFANIQLIDKYDIYQIFMNYCEEVMQDDIYQISFENWKKASEISIVKNENNKNKKEKITSDIVIGSGKKSKKFRAELIPPELIVNCYYTNEKKVIDKFQSEREFITQQIEEMVNENSGEEGFLEDIKNEKDKLNKTSLKERIKEIKSDDEFADEMIVLQKAQKLLDEERAFTSKIKDKQLELNKKTVAHYPKLRESEIKTLVVNDKWFARLNTCVHEQIKHVTQNLVIRIKELEERYAHPMPKLVSKIEDYSKLVDQHLKKMGLTDNKNN